MGSGVLLVPFYSIPLSFLPPQMTHFRQHLHIPINNTSPHHSVLYPTLVPLILTEIQSKAFFTFASPVSVNFWIHKTSLVPFENCQGHLEPGSEICSGRGHRSLLEKGWHSSIGAGNCNQPGIGKCQDCHGQQAPFSGGL